MSYTDRVIAWNQSPRWGEEAVALLDRLDLQAGQSVLDYGCGPGAMTRLLHLRGARVVGTDPSPEMMRVARSAGPSKTFIDWPIESSGRFDLILVHHVLAHVDDDRAALAELAAMLEPGGRLVVVTPNASYIRLTNVRNRLVGRVHVPDPTLRRKHYTARSLATVLAAALPGEDVVVTRLGKPIWLGRARPRLVGVVTRS